MTSSISRRQDHLPPAAPSSRRLRVLAIFAVFLAAVVAAAVLGWRFAEASKPISGPIVLISVDTLRADRLGVYGRHGASTPNLDRLARDAFVFERAYAHVPQTLPSHASILTGLLPFEHGVRDDTGFTLDARHQTLATRLSERGFETGAAVSSSALRVSTGIERGFGAYDAELPARPPMSLETDLTRDGAETLDAAETWLAAQQSTRFFYFLHLNEPHAPYTPPARFSTGTPYEGEIAYADELVGRFLTALERKGLYDQALIIVTSDHGEGLGDHGEQEHGLFLYDEAVRVPLIVKMPGAADAHLVSVPVQHVDLVPTVLDLVRAPLPQRLRGRSLRPLLEGRADGSPPAQGIYAEALYGRVHFGWADLHSLTDDRYRFIDAPRAELYDLERDPGERSNLAASRRNTLTAMAGAADRLRAGANVDEPRRVSAADLETLAPLGYGVPPARASGVDEPGADPKDMVPLLEAYRRASVHAAAGRLAEAIDGLDAIVRAYPEMADMWRRLGLLEQRAGRFDDAIASFQRFADLTPESPHGPFMLAKALLARGLAEDAARHAGLALDLADADDKRLRAEIYELAIRAALAQKDPTTARRLAAEAQGADPTLALGPYVEARLLHERDDAEGALPLFEEAVEASARHGVQIGELFWYLGDTLSRLDRYADAEKAFKQELAAAPGNVRAYASLATLYHASRRDAAAAETIAALVRAVPTPEAYAIADRLRMLVNAAEPPRR